MLQELLQKSLTLRIEDSQDRTEEEMKADFNIDFEVICIICMYMNHKMLSLHIWCILCSKVCQQVQIMLQERNQYWLTSHGYTVKKWSSIRTSLNKFEVFGVQVELLFQFLDLAESHVLCFLLFVLQRLKIRTI